MSDTYRNMETFFMALADRTRLRLLNLINDGEVCVCFFTETLGEPQPKISRHLAYLRRAGVVEARRDGKWMHYRIVEPEDENAARVLREVQKWLASDEQMNLDRERFESVCCTLDVPEQLKRAPIPITRVADEPKKNDSAHDETPSRRPELEEYLL
jgi:ArsR family transcriptional regulator